MVRSTQRPELGQNMNRWLPLAILVTVILVTMTIAYSRSTSAHTSCASGHPDSG